MELDTCAEGERLAEVGNWLAATELLADRNAWTGRVPLEPSEFPIQSRQGADVLTREERDRFFREAEKWRRETLFLSSIREILDHASYKNIIELGPKIIPLILIELRDRPTYWFSALEILAVRKPRILSTNFNEKRKAWLLWGVNSGMLERLRPSDLSNFPKTRSGKSQTKKSVRSNL